MLPCSSVNTTWLLTLVQQHNSGLWVNIMSGNHRAEMLCQAQFRGRGTRHCKHNVMSGKHRAEINLQVALWWNISKSLKRHHLSRSNKQHTVICSSVSRARWTPEYQTEPKSERIVQSHGQQDTQNKSKQARAHINNQIDECLPLDECCNCNWMMRTLSSRFQ
jgi:hypothetical protein